jgi:PKD repeat protein
LITLTDQCSDIETRAISFSYTGKGNNTFTGLELLSGFTDVSKSKRITSVTQNVMAEHHNQLKDALIAIQRFVGTQGEISATPLTGTMEARTNFLRKLVLKPKGWFTPSKRIGIVPLCVEFKDFSTREPDVWIWDFGDGIISTISRTGTISVGDISKCYYLPGIYDVKLTVTNDFGTDTITIPDLITARLQSPDEATMVFTPSSTQKETTGVLRSRVNELIAMTVTDNGEQSGDPVTKYIWELGDDLEHDTVETANASYSIGGIYDVKIRTETNLGAYRITTFEDSIDIIEKFNVWHFIFNPLSSGVTKTVYAYEFGLLSETYKAAATSSSSSVTRDDGFLTGVSNETQQKQEFKRNNGFAARSLVSSGNNGDCVLFWSEGAAASGMQHSIKFKEFNGFENTWTTPVLSNSTDKIDRQWNWLSLDSSSSLYFLFGSPGPSAFVGSPTDQNFSSLALSSYSVDTISFTTSNYLNGAEELMENVGGGGSGHFSVYRGTWADSNGYFVRNDGVGSFFRLKSFYKTEGITSSPLQTIRKLVDMPGTTKFEGQLAYLSRGIYFFNNTGEVMLYDITSNTWKVGGPGVGSPDFAKLQDSSVSGYSGQDNTLVIATDQSTKAYLYFDYSTKANMKFNETDMTFSSLPVRPSGEQFLAGLY